MKISTLVQLIIQVAEINSLENSKNDECDSNASQRTLTDTNRPQTQDSERTYEECPYLIVDLRDKDEFNTNHIVSAHHYPATMLSRCTNNESKELLIYVIHFLIYHLIYLVTDIRI
ncbi:unnamed protein product [Rotaria sp. Silwood1]|nr:unnamed protein product [Rotaria sp. Silwood1]